MNIAKHPPCAPNCPLRGMGCHAKCEDYRAWREQMELIAEQRSRAREVDQGVAEVQLHRKEWLRKRGYRT